MEEYNLIVAGGRDFTDEQLLAAELEKLANTELKAFAVNIVTGMARGADRLGYLYALEHGVMHHKFYADWDRLGRRAGIVRNEEMGRFADGLLAFWDQKSTGTKHMIEFMRAQQKPVRVIHY